MKQRQLLEFLHLIEKLKCNTRHSWTSSGRHESVAEHCWRLTVMAMLLEEEFPDTDMNKVIRMCLVHDFGEAVLGDIPSFLKTAKDEENEDRAIGSLLSHLPEDTAKSFSTLFAEMNALSTPEAKIYKALDNLEAVISHNEAPISTWLPLEYSENLTYGTDKVAFSEYLIQLKAEINDDTRRKIQDEKS